MTTIRELTADDAEADLRLGTEAFGDRPQATGMAYPRPGTVSYGVFADDRLVAKLRCRDFRAVLPGGAEVPSLGIAGVAVAAEHRGSGLLTGLFDRAFAHAQDQGQAVSTLFPTAAGIYRRFGYAVTGSLSTVEVPSLAAAAVAEPSRPVRLRRATVRDSDSLQSLYLQWAAGGVGALARTGPSEPLHQPQSMAEFTAVTIAEDDSGVVGSCWWDRGVGDHPATAVLRVENLITRTPDAARALWRMLGSHSPVAGRIHVRTSLPDPALAVLPGHCTPVGDRPYMLALLDIPAAFHARPAPTGLTASLPFSVVGAAAPAVDGDYVLHAEGGEVRCARSDHGGGPCFTATGVADLYGGHHRCADLRATGQLTGPADQDGAWDALCSARTRVRDYF